MCYDNEFVEKMCSFLNKHIQTQATVFAIFPLSFLGIPILSLKITFCIFLLTKYTSSILGTLIGFLFQKQHENLTFSNFIYGNLGGINSIALI